MKGIACCVFAGVFRRCLSVSVGRSDRCRCGVLVASGVCILFVDSKLLRKALLLSKEQDRKYFLSSIRAANACNELDWAGLFSYKQASKTGPHSDADQVRLDVEVGYLASGLRAAFYNDEYFQYSPANLKVTHI